MLKPFHASFSMLALLVGFIGAPHTHLHVFRPNAPIESGHGHAILHSHTTSHAQDHGHEHGPEDPDSRDTEGLSVDAFVFQLVKSPTLAGTAVLLPEALAPPGLTPVWTSVAPSTPPHYGSPPILSAASRAPPTLTSPTV